MTSEEAKAHCANRGSVLRHYEPGRVASIVIPSGEVLIISLGTATAKILAKRTLLGWLLPKTIGTKNLSDWVPDYRTCSGLQRSVARAMVLDGLVSLASRAKYADELSLAWIVLKNPIEVAVEDCGWGVTQKEETRTTEEQTQSEDRDQPSMKQAETNVEGRRRILQPPPQPNMTPIRPDATLAKIVGDKTMLRSELTKLLWVYIRENGLQDETDKQLIHADENLKAVFNGKRDVNIFELTELVSGHLKEERA
jgi:hypothetical protein